MTQTPPRANESAAGFVPYDVAEHLRTPEEMAAYLDAWLEEAPDDVAGLARALGGHRPSEGNDAGGEGDQGTPPQASCLRRCC
jgi:hypothetical protein